MSDIRRWLFLVLIFAYAVVLYLSRMELGVVAPVVQREFGLSAASYASALSAFQIAYIAGSLLMGVVIWLIGPRWAYGIVILGSAAAALTTGLAGGLTALVAGRFLLGLFSGGGNPAAIQSVSECVPRKVQAIAIGVFLFGILTTSFWAILPVASLTLRWGWRAPFYVIASAGLLWLLMWGGLALWTSLSPDPPTPAAGIADGLRALTLPQSWLYVLARVLIDPLFWFLHVLSPSYARELGATTADLGRYGWEIGVAAVGGALVGALASDIAALTGLRLAQARSIVVLVAGVLLFVTGCAGLVQSPSGFIALVAIGAAAYQALSVSLYASLAGAVPSRGVGLVTGIGGGLSGLVLMLGSTLTRTWGGAALPSLFAAIAVAGAICAYFVARRLPDAQTRVRLPPPPPLPRLTAPGFDRVP